MKRVTRRGFFGWIAGAAAAVAVPFKAKTFADFQAEDDGSRFGVINAKPHAVTVAVTNLEIGDRVAVYPAMRSTWQQAIVYGDAAADTVYGMHLYDGRDVPVIVRVRNGGPFSKGEPILPFEQHADITRDGLTVAAVRVPDRVAYS